MTEDTNVHEPGMERVVHEPVSSESEEERKHQETTITTLTIPSIKIFLSICSHTKQYKDSTIFFVP